MEDWINQLKKTSLGKHKTEEELKAAIIRMYKEEGWTIDVDEEDDPEWVGFSNFINNNN